MKRSKIDKLEVLNLGKGSRTERELVNLLWEYGFAVMRSPASGSGRKHPQPDILVSDGDVVYGIETKSSSKEKIYVKKEEIQKLEDFCKQFGCDPLIGVRFDRKNWTFFKPEECEKTEKSYKITKEMIGLVLSEEEGFCKQETFS